MSFRRIPGDPRRRAFDPTTGEIISRRQFDQKYGRLAGSGLTFDSQAKLRKPGNILSGVTVSHKADTSYLFNRSGYSDAKREEILRHFAANGKKAVRFVYEERGQRQSSEWSLIQPKENLEAAIGESKKGLDYPKKGGGIDHYSADSLVGFAFV